ncbi:9212_t:CDS:10 [Diversispora eburnea]|uniref:9212_t:CDS:1 n=2 Tax=Diversisporales TaxID=214509 RepID=A0A9N9BLE5_9GLOM|nr:9212_t:CDS:10 [Diversispora eburnea]
MSFPSVRTRGYLPIEDYGLFGNLRTVALCGTDGSIDFMCYPKFDRHFSIAPLTHKSEKQQYLPSTNILSTRFLSDQGVSGITDFMHIPVKTDNPRTLLPWLIRHVEVTRGEVDFHLELFPAFNYARDSHTTKIVDNKIDSTLPPKLNTNDLGNKKIIFSSDTMDMDFRFVIKASEKGLPNIEFKLVESEVFKGPGIVTNFTLKEKQEGRWREHVHRSALTLKLLTYEPTGAAIASPTFGLPEEIGGERNWDYRFTWVRDSAFTLYALMRIGMTEEAKLYMKFMEERCKDLNEDGSLNIMYSIDGHKELTEIELDHLEGYLGSRPVRIGNGAYDHLQLDIYGELLDAVYLFNKLGSPISYDTWVNIKKMVNYVCDNWDKPDMSIWEVRGKQQNFTYSKIMCWVAVDRGIRFTEKREFPCSDRFKWLSVRDKIYEQVMEKAWNPQLQIFAQSYESIDALDSSVLIMPLVFFISPTDPRFLSTMRKIMKPPTEGGLLENSLVYRYDFVSTDDGLRGDEGSFSMCTFWLVEALTRAGKYDKKLLEKAEIIFERMIGYGNHLGLYSEEIARSGELLGNFPQAFTHIAFISAAFNLDRVLTERSGKRPRLVWTKEEDEALFNAINSVLTGQWKEVCTKNPILKARGTSMVAQRFRTKIRYFVGGNAERTKQ